MTPVASAVGSGLSGRWEELILTSSLAAWEEEPAVQEEKVSCCSPSLETRWLCLWVWTMVRTEYSRFRIILESLLQTSLETLVTEPEGILHV